METWLHKNDFLKDIAQAIFVVPINRYDQEVRMFFIF